MNELIQTDKDGCNTMSVLIQTIKTDVIQYTNKYKQKRRV